MTAADGLRRRVGRLATDAVLRDPRLWRVFRAPLRAQFDRLAAGWDERVGTGHVEVLRVALEHVAPPRRALDLGTGTGAAAFAVARRFPHAEVVGVDIAPRMVEAASAKIPAGFEDRVRFVVADASALPLPDASCDLATLANMIPFFDELDRVLRPDATVLVASAFGPQTPIWVPPQRLRTELGRRGFAEFADFGIGRATCLLARRTTVRYGAGH